MVRQKRKPAKKVFRYFFLNDKLHKVLKASRSKDEIIAWCYPDHKRVLYAYSQVNKHMGKAHTLTEVCKYLNKHRVTVQDYILEGKIRTPSKIYSISNPENTDWYRYMFNESDILELHEFILDSGHSAEMPSKSELLGLLKHNIILYTKTDNGFIPVWKAE
jgi:hypothetical protein